MSISKALRPEAIRPVAETAEKIEPQNCGSTIAAFKQSLIWMREMPGILRGLLHLAWPFKWRMGAILGFNILIACWEIALATVVAVTITIMNPEALQGPFTSILLGLTACFLVLQLPTEVVVVYLREWYATKFFKPYLEKELICRAAQAVQKKGASGHDELSGNTAPIAKEGRQASYTLIDMMLRDTAFAARGLGVFIYAWCLSWHLGVLLLIGMLVDLWITLKMDVRCAPLYQRQKDRNLAMIAQELKVHEPVKLGARLSGDERWEQRIRRNMLDKACDEHIDAVKAADLTSIHWQTLRSVVSKVFMFTLTGIIAFWVYTGKYDLAQFMIFTSLLIRAREPLTVFLQFQSSVMANRELLRRFSLIMGVDFGIKPKPSPV